MTTKAIAKSVGPRWQYVRLKFLKNGAFMYGANEAAECLDPSFPRFIRITDIAPDGDLREETFRSLPEELAAPYFLQDGDILLARSGATVGKAFRYRPSWGRACFAGYLIRVRANKKKILPEYLHYYTQSRSYEDEVRNGTIQATIQNVSAEKYANFVVPLPPLDDQRAIADFLDGKTAALGALIEKKERLIELLQEKRQALITQAVTKGLDASVPMKNSEVEWLGEIPAHWTTSKLTHAAFFQEGPGLRNWQFADAGVRVICVTNITEHGIEFGEYQKFISVEEYERSYRHFTVGKGDILLSSSGNSWGKTAEYESDDVAILNTSTIRLNAHRSGAFIQPFIRWVLASACTREQLGLLMTGACQPNFGPSHLARVVVAMPPHDEQERIATHLTRSTARLEFVRDLVHRDIDLLREYRQALITAAVTGKIDVRERET